MAEVASEDSGLTALKCSLIRVFACHLSHIMVRFTVIVPYGLRTQTVASCIRFFFTGLYMHYLVNRLT